MPRLLAPSLIFQVWLLLGLAAWIIQILNLTFLVLGRINIFDNIPALTPQKLSAASNKLDQYLNTDVEHVMDALAWWYDHCKTYPHLSCMALDYLTIPGMCFPF